MIDAILLAFVHSAAVGVLSCLVSESNILAPMRKALTWPVLYCPLCLGFWIALPCMFWGPLHYLLVVAFSNVWMLITMLVYEAIDRASVIDDDDDQPEM
jgi:hypothetical protein